MLFYYRKCENPSHKLLNSSKNWSCICTDSTCRNFKREISMSKMHFAKNALRLIFFKMSAEMSLKWKINICVYGVDKGRKLICLKILLFKSVKDGELSKISFVHRQKTLSEFRQKKTSLSDDFGRRKYNGSMTVLWLKGNVWKFAFKSHTLILKLLWLEQSKWRLNRNVWIDLYARKIDRRQLKINMSHFIFCMRFDTIRYMNGIIVQFGTII